MNADELVINGTYSALGMRKWLTASYESILLESGTLIKLLEFSNPKYQTSGSATFEVLDGDLKGERVSILSSYIEREVTKEK